MRRFLIVSHKAKGNGDFSLDDLPGAGRMDILAISSSSALFLSHSLRKDVEVWILFSDSVLLRIIGSEAKYLFPDERNMAAAIRNALIRNKAGKKMLPGIYIDSMDLESALKTAAEDSAIYYLKEDGKDAYEVEFHQNSTFVLGDHMDLTEEEESLVKKFNANTISLGKNSLHTYQAIVIVHHILDRRDENAEVSP